MRGIKRILIIPILLLTNFAEAGEPLYWLTYGHSKYVMSPGIEACYLFRPHLGVNLGIAVYRQNPDHSLLTNITHNASFGLYSVNMGISGYLFRSENHSAGLITGFKLYYGPDYRNFVTMRKVIIISIMMPPLFASITALILGYSMFIRGLPCWANGILHETESG